LVKSGGSEVKAGKIRGRYEKEVSKKKENIKEQSAVSSCSERDYLFRKESETISNVGRGGLGERARRLEALEKKKKESKRKKKGGILVGGGVFGGVLLLGPERIKLDFGGWGKRR